MMLRFGLLFLQVFPLMAAAQTVTIVLRETATVESRQVLLSDVASVSGADPALARLVGSVQVALLGGAERPLRIGRAAIAHVLDKRLPSLRTALQVSGAADVHIAMAGKLLDMRPVYAIAQRFLEPVVLTRDPAAEIILIPSSDYDAVSVPEGEAAFAARVVSNTLSPRMHVLVDISIDNKYVRTVPVWFQVRATRTAWQLTQAVKAGTILDPRLARAVRVSVSEGSSAQALFADAAIAPAMKLTRDKAAESLLSMADLAPQSPVGKGRELRVTANRAGIDVEDRAVALMDGTTGSSITVINPRTRQSYQATVVDRDTAEAR
ncbi:MAG: putative flagellar protein FlgA precursor [Herminiimonas sp.]|nr:putative flagellar protein FlgA precursor [Herminiimonas sp.]